ncbi:hypothetical protein Tco_0813370 [Tanacetum coccineum]
MIDCLSIVETDKVNHAVETDIVKLVVEIKSFGTSSDEFDKETRFNMDKAKVVRSSLTTNFKLTAKDCPSFKKNIEKMDRVPYASAVGSLMYAMVCTRSDLAHAVGVVSRFLSNPGKKHWEVVKWIFRYPRGTSKLGITFGNGKLMLVGFTDLNMAGNKDNMKSTSGYLMTFTGGAVSWQSRLQKCVALSTTDAEYMAATKACKELLWLKRFLQELGFKQQRYAVLCDNQSAIHLAKNSMFHKRTKHIDIRYHWIRDVIEDGMFELNKVHTDDNASDMLTKAVVREKLKITRSKVTGFCLQQSDVLLQKSGEKSNQRPEYNTTTDEFFVCYDYDMVNLANDDSSWILDSGATCHVATRKDYYLSSFTQVTWVFVRMSNTRLSRIASIGDICLKFDTRMELVLHNVKHVLDMRLNIISTGFLMKMVYHKPVCIKGLTEDTKVKWLAEALNRTLVERGVMMLMLKEQPILDEDVLPEFQYLISLGDEDEFLCMGHIPIVLVKCAKRKRALKNKWVYKLKTEEHTSRPRLRKDELRCGRLQKSLYGLKQAPRQWYKKFERAHLAHAVLVEGRWRLGGVVSRVPCPIWYKMHWEAVKWIFRYLTRLSLFWGCLRLLGADVELLLVFPDLIASS